MENFSRRRFLKVAGLGALTVGASVLEGCAGPIQNSLSSGVQIGGGHDKGMHDMNHAGSTGKRIYGDFDPGSSDSRTE